MENFLWVTIGDQQFRTAQTKHIPKAFSIILKDFEQIIEIGTFTGAFTHWLSENKSDSCKIISYDINPDYLQVNNIKDTTLRVADCFDVDVIGGLNLKRMLGDQALAIFVQPPSYEELENRLRYRSTETEDKIQQRMKKAHQELASAKEFDIILVNDQLDQAIAKAKDMVISFIKQ